MAKKRAKVIVETKEPRGLSHSPFAALLPAPPAGAPDAVPPEEPPAASAPASTRFPGKVVVRREKKGRGGKTITRVAGVSPAHLDELAAAMKKALGCGATVEGADVILLGSLVARAAAWLTREGARQVVADDGKPRES